MILSSKRTYFYNRVYLRTKKGLAIRVGICITKCKGHLWKFNQYEAIGMLSGGSLMVSNKNCLVFLSLLCNTEFKLQLKQITFLLGSM